MTKITEAQAELLSCAANEAGRAAIAHQARLGTMLVREGGGLDILRTAAPREASKIAKLIALLLRPEGAHISEMMAATGWQAHSIRGAMSGALRRKFGLTIVSEATPAGRVLPRSGGVGGTLV